MRKKSGLSNILFIAFAVGTAGFHSTQAFALALGGVMKALEEGTEGAGNGSAGTNINNAGEAGSPSQDPEITINPTQNGTSGSSLQSGQQGNLNDSSNHPGSGASSNSNSNESSKNDSGKHPPLLGAVAVGPTIALGLPHPVNVGLQGRALGFLGFAFNYGFLPTLTISNVSAKISAWDLRARLFPFQGSFFFGLAFGNQSLTGTRTDTIASASQSTSMAISTTTLTPHLGWRWGGIQGFTFGIDLGVQLAQKHTTSLTTSANATQRLDPSYQSMVSDLNKLGDDIGKQTLPFVTLFEVGYLF